MLFIAIRYKRGLDLEVTWNLEAGSYIFGVKPDATGFILSIFESDRLNKRKLIYECGGDFESLIAPLYRSLKGI